MSFYIAGVATGLLFALMLAFILDILNSEKDYRTENRKNKIKRVKAKDIQIFTDLYKKIGEVNVNEIN